MIKLSEFVIMVTNHDGTMIEFEGEQFQAEIIRCFLTTGNNELWVAEDIVMAVEYALLAHDNPEKIFALIEIESIITGILEDAGFAEVAECYSQTHMQRNITFSPERDYLLKLLHRHAGLSGGTLAAVTDKVIAAGAQLNIDAAAPELFVALAKYYKSQILSKRSPNIGKLPLPASNSIPHRISVAEIKEHLTASSINYLNNNIIHLYSISSLFPAVRIAINMNKLAEHSRMLPPVTELLLMADFSKVANAVNDAIQATELVFFNSMPNSEHTLPLHISVPDMSEFAEHWLEATWPECRPCCRDMMNLIENMLIRKPFKLTMR